MSVDAQQLDLFDPRPYRRNTDPATSHQAAAELKVILGQMQKRAVDAVKRYPGRTARELAQILELEDPRTINRRLGEVERKGLIRRGKSRPCQKTGKNAATWWPVSQGGQA